MEDGSELRVTIKFDRPVVRLQDLHQIAREILTYVSGAEKASLWFRERPENLTMTREETTGEENTMRCVIDIEMDNAAFSAMEGKGHELVRILEQLAYHVEVNGYEEKKIYDTNGNHVGGMLFIK